MAVPTLRVLLVDDNPEDRALIARELRREHPGVLIQDVVGQHQLDEALEACQFDVVITDYQLPWNTGLGVLQAVKARAPRCPVIMFTATGNEEVAVEAMKNGLDDYIVKNVKHLVRLRGAVRSAVQHARTLHAAEQLQTRLASLLSRLRVGVFACSPEGRLREANAAFLRMFGFASLDDCLGQPFRDRFVEPARYDAYVEALIAGRQPRPIELEARTVGGETLWVEVSQSPQGPAGGEAALEGLVDDITARKRLEGELRARDAELAHLTRLSTLGEMVAAIAHEVNQPLYAVSNYAGGILARLRKGTSDLDQLREVMELITEQINRAARILRKYRGFASKGPSERTTFPIGPVLRECLDLVAPEIRDRQVAVEWDLMSPSPEVVADRTQICQVVVNLLRNACEAMHETPSPDRRIRLRTRISGPNVQVSVSDGGHGLPPTGYQELLDPFVTTKPDGMGMGLAVCSRIIRAHEGQLWATPNPERGATFHFTLPRAGQDQSAGEQPA